MRIQPIVEGHGELGAVGVLTACGKSHAAFERRCIPAEPRLYEALCVAFRSKYTRYSSLTRLVSRAPRRSRCSRHFLHRLLIRRLLQEASVWDVDVARPIRRSRGQLTQRQGLALALQLARNQNGPGPVLILFDGDDDCPAELASRVLGWASEEAGDIPCEVVLAHREYEAWFLGAIESLRGERGIRTDAGVHPSPETPRDAKGALEERMQPSMSYAETTDQAALTARFSLEAAYARCRSFRKLAKAFGALLQTMDRAPARWPPSAWTNT